MFESVLISRGNFRCVTLREKTRQSAVAWTETHEGQTSLSSLLLLLFFLLFLFLTAVGIQLIGALPPPSVSSSSFFFSSSSSSSSFGSMAVHSLGVLPPRQTSQCASTVKIYITYNKGRFYEVKNVSFVN